MLRASALFFSVFSMETLALFGSVAVLQLFALMSPGPDFIMCLRQSLVHGRRAGVFTSLGFALGILVHVGYCLLGLAFLISQSIVLFNVIKVLGGAYLLWMGYQSFRATETTVDVSDVQRASISTMSNVAAVRVGFFTNVLNPKATLFFLGMFTLVISPDLALNVRLGLGAVCVVMTFLWFSFVSFVLTHGPVRRVFLRSQKWINKVFGVVLVGFGLKVMAEVAE